MEFFREYPSQSLEARIHALGNDPAQRLLHAYYARLESEGLSPALPPSLPIDPVAVSSTPRRSWRAH